MTKLMFAVSLAAALVAGSVSVSAQKQQQIFISLTTADGKPVDGLQTGDVSITENDVNCKVVKVEPVDWPTSFRCSSTMAGRTRPPSTRSATG